MKFYAESGTWWPEISCASFASFHCLNFFLIRGVLNISDTNMAAKERLDVIYIYLYLEFIT
jgi:hypothetical protein